MTEDDVIVLATLGLMQQFSRNIPETGKAPTATSISACCGAMLAYGNVRYSQLRPYRSSRIIGEFFPPDKDIRQDTADNVILIPDETGSLLLEWTDA